MPISMGKQYRTRSGRAVRLLAVDAGGKHPVVAVVAGIEGGQVYCPDGAFYGSGLTDDLDLVELPPVAVREHLVRNGHGELVTVKMTFRGSELVTATVAA